MITLTLTQSDGGTTAITPSCNIVFGTLWEDETINQFEMRTVDGADVIYDGGGPIICHGNMILKNLSYTDGIALIGWVRSTIIFAYNRFTIGAVANTDLGKGKNTQITNCRWDGGPSMKGLAAYDAPGIYTINFPYRFTR